MASSNSKTSLHKEKNDSSTSAAGSASASAAEATVTFVKTEEMVVTKHHKRKTKVVSVLSNKNICHEMRHGNILLNPFDQTKLDLHGYHLRLGNYYATPNTDKEYEPNSLKGLWGKVSEANKKMIIPPHCTVRSHSLEFLAVNEHLFAHFDGNIDGLIISCRLEQLTNGGRLLFNIYNTLDKPVILNVGQALGLLTFHYTDDLDKEDITVKMMESMQAKWTADDILK